MEPTQETPRPTQTQETPIQRDNGDRLKKILLRQEIEKVLKLFNCTQLMQQEITSLFELEPEDIIDKCHELRIPKSKQSLASLMSRRLKQNFTLDEMKEIHHTLKLYRTVFCSKLKKWIPINLLEPVDHFQRNKSVKNITLDIQQAYRIKGLNAIIKIIEYEDLVWLMVIEKKLTRKKGIKLKPPLFFCHELNTPYIFISSTSKVSAESLECVLKALQYKKCKYQQLDGKDVKSLLSLLKNREVYKENLSSLEYNEGEVEVASRSIDFAHVKSRKNYGNQVFSTKDPVHVSSFTANANVVWAENSLVPEMAGEQWGVKMVLTSKTGSVIDLIKDMHTKNEIVTPIPKYLQEVIKSGKNKIYLRAN